MSKIKWDGIGERLYETGVDHGVLYVIDEDGKYGEGEAWNGLVSVTQSPEGAEPNPVYADNIKYLNLLSAEEFKGTIEAYTYPESFAACDGTLELVQGVFAGQQNRKSFGLSYRTILGNDIRNNDYGYKLHLIYGAVAQPSEKAHETVNDSPEAVTFSWEFDTSPVALEGGKPTSILTIDSTKVKTERMQDLLNVLYGTEDAAGYLPLPSEVITMLESAG